jgi:hypothetical protein
MRMNHAESATMQIGEVAERTAFTADAIRFYERRNLLPKAVRSEGRFCTRKMPSNEFASSGKCKGWVSPCAKSEN